MEPSSFLRHRHSGQGLSIAFREIPVALLRSSSGHAKRPTRMRHLFSHFGRFGRPYAAWARVEHVAADPNAALPLLIPAKRPFGCRSAILIMVREQSREAQLEPQPRQPASTQRGFAFGHCSRSWRRIVPGCLKVRRWSGHAVHEQS
jgi:hypothetical protein